MSSLNLATSVIIPVYLAEPSVQNVRLLARALDSVFTQAFPDSFEVLVIDDGSPIPVANLANLTGQDRNDKIRWIRRKRNGGIVSALNAGLREARYPFIARLDADDRWCQGKLEKQFAVFANDSDLTIVATGMTLMTVDGAVIEKLIRPGDWSGVLRFFVEGGCPFPHGSVVARKDIYRLLGGYPHNQIFSHCEDYALWGAWLRFFKPAMVEELLYDYTVSSTSVSNRSREQQARGSRLVNASFASLNLTNRLPRALSDLADLLGISVLQAGVLSYRMWNYKLAANLPREAIEPLRTILCDMDVGLVKGGDAGAIEMHELLHGFCSPDAKYSTYKDVVIAHPS
jgi:glycosyltransferase involved in cell wall biosynthesis